MKVHFKKLVLSWFIGFLFYPIGIQSSPLTGNRHYLPFEIINNTHIADDTQIYVVIKATHITDGQDCFIHLDKASGQGSCENVTDKTRVSQYFYKLSDLPKDAEKRKIYLPQVASGRIYFSMAYPMDFHIDAKTQKITDPDGFKSRDSNYYTLYDKVEFTYTENGMWINPTAVDFFSLPITLEHATSGGKKMKSGLSEARAVILNKIHGIFNADDRTTQKVWNKLFLNTKNSEGNNTLLRIIAPAKAMVSTNVESQSFDPNYLSHPELYQFDYINFLWDFYRTHTLVVDCSEISAHFPLDNYKMVGQVLGNKFVFTNKTNHYSVSIDKPTHSAPFFAGAGETFNAENNTPKAIIIRQLTAAFDVGLLPAESEKVIDKNYFLTSKDQFYQDNALLPKTLQGPWYDLYSKALHSFGDQEPIYTFAYDDALGQDGTLHDSNADNPAPITLTLQDMTDTIIPNPYEDPTLYTITPVIGANSTVVYKGETLQSNKPITNVTIPFHVSWNGKETYIYVKNPLVKPYVEGADGILIQRDSGSVTTVRITFPGRSDGTKVRHDPPST